jgi:hypothetical protein
LVVLVLGQLTNLVTTVGQGLKKIVVFIPIQVTTVGCAVKQLGGALQGHFEQRLG